jgi:hypothetical protein
MIFTRENQRSPRKTCPIATLSTTNSKVLTKICGPKVDKVSGKWKMLHNGDLHDLYSLPNIFRIVK